MSDAHQLFSKETPILIVDDSSQFAMVLTRLLAGIFGYTAITVLNSTADALERVVSAPGEFKLLFLDFHFPTGMDGGELLATLAKKGLIRDKIVFIMSSDPTAEALQQVVRAGAAGVITKPFDRDELRRQLERAHRLSEGDDDESFSQ